MKLNWKKTSMIFSLLLILLLSLAVVSAEELESSDSVSDGIDSQVPEVNINSDSGGVSGGHPDSIPFSGNAVSSGSGVNTVHHSDSNSRSGEAIVFIGNCEGTVVENNDIRTYNNNDGGSDNLNAVSNDYDYSISVKNITATEKTNVTIIANVKNYETPVNSGFARFLLWRDGDTDVDEIVPVVNGQGILNIKLPSASNTPSLNWECLAAFYDEYGDYQANTTFYTQIKRAVNPTTIFVGDIVGKMGKKVTLVANVYDTDGLKVTSGKLTFTVNGKTYTVDVKNGKASKTITAPFVGIYTVKVNYKGVGAYKASSAKFKLASDLKAKIGYYKSITVKKGAKKYYKITLTNYFTKKPLKSFKVKFKVKINKKTWKTYTLKSNSKGVIKWSTKKLSVGTHNVKISSAYKYFKINLKGKIIVKRK